MTEDRLCLIRSLLSSASTLNKGNAKLAYLSAARNLLVQLQEEMKLAEHAIHAIESELDREEYRKSP